MGMMELLSGLFKKKPHADTKAKCPKCKGDVVLGMERCPACGTHIDSMFRIKCPACDEANDLNAEKCKKCGTGLVGQQVPPGGAGKAQYRCPLCGYVADYYMTSCPSCGVKFI